MPIRTQRGRAAVWRRLWGWPLTSYRHLLLTVAAVATVGAVIGVAASSHDSTDHAAAPARQSAPSSWPAPAQGPATRPPATTPVETPGDPAPTNPIGPVAPTPPEVSQLAGDFTRELVNHPPGTSNAQWVDHLRPYVTPETAGLMETVDPANMSIHLTGPAHATTVTPSVVHMEAPMDRGTLQLVMLNVSPGRWQVQSYDETN